MEFKVKWLNSEDFERLPYKKATTALGLADKNTGTVYVRDTGNVALDSFSVYHELEHLKGNDHGEHEDPDEKGVYYKDTGGWLQSAAAPLAFVPGVGPALSAASGIGGSFMSRNKQQQPQQQGGTMDQFNPAASATPASPATSQVGGGGDAMAGGMEQGTIAKLRGLLNQRSKGFYAGRDAGAMQ